MLRTTIGLLWICLGLNASTVYQVADLGSYGQAPGTAMNDRGDVGGSGVDSSGRVTAVVTLAGVTTWLGTLSGGGWSAVYGLNNGGEVVGASELGNGEIHAFSWSAAQGMVDLNTLIAGMPWTLREAHGIDERGAIVGMGLYNGQQRGFLMSPALTDFGWLCATSQAPAVDGAAAPEPGTWMLMAGGLVALVMRWRRG